MKNPIRNPWLEKVRAKRLTREAAALKLTRIQRSNEALAKANGEPPPRPRNTRYSPLVAAALAATALSTLR